MSAFLPLKVNDFFVPVEVVAMVRSRLIELMKKRHPEISGQDVEMIVHLIFQSLADEMARGRDVELRGFGMFRIRKYGKRMVRNPATGRISQLKPRKKILFRAGNDIKARLNIG